MATTYSDVDLASWSTQVKGRNQFGSPTVLIASHGQAPRVALSRRDEPRGVIPFKVDLDKAPDVLITLTEDQVAFLERVDEWAVQEALAHSEEWFGRAYSEEELRAMYVSCLRKHERYAAKLRAKLILTGPYATRVTYVGQDGARRAGSGLDFVKSLLGPDDWRGHEARGCLQLRRIWMVGPRFGLSASYTDLVVVEKERPAAAVADFPECD